MIDKIYTNKTENNNNYGTEIENCISTISLVNLNINSINEKIIYTKEYRKVYGLKLVLCKKYHKEYNNEDYISRLLDEGKYKIVPFSNNYFEVTYEIRSFYISYNEDGLFLKERNYKNIRYEFIASHKIF